MGQIMQTGGKLARSTCLCCRNIFAGNSNKIGIDRRYGITKPHFDANGIIEPGSDEALGHFQLVMLLDGAVRKANSIRYLGRRYHPYHLATDLSTVAIVLFSGWYTTRLPHLRFLGFVIAFTTMLCLYWGVRQVRFRWLGISARSYVQDTITVLLPTYALASLAVGNPLTQSMDLIALDLALGIAFIRVGCFLGGCCYGRPVSWGVQYSADCLVQIDGWRSFRSGPIPSDRVLPLQLFEAAFNLVLFGTLLGWGQRDPHSEGRLLPAYFLAYAVWRVPSDVWRATSSRPRRMGLTEAQLTCLIVGLVAGTMLFV